LSPADGLGVYGGPNPPKRADDDDEEPHARAIVTGAIYASRDALADEPLAVMLDDRPDDGQLLAIARRFNETAAQRRPLLMCAYLPSHGVNPANFPAYGLPRPVPILPLLIRARHYNQKPGAPSPTSYEFAVLVADAVKKLLISRDRRLPKV
jgi:hypothetical protein